MPSLYQHVMLLRVNCVSTPEKQPGLSGKIDDVIANKKNMVTGYPRTDLS